MRRRTPCAVRARGRKTATVARRLPPVQSRPAIANVHFHCAFWPFGLSHSRQPRGASSALWHFASKRPERQASGGRCISADCASSAVPIQAAYPLRDFVGEARHHRGDPVAVGLPSDGLSRHRSAFRSARAYASSNAGRRIGTACEVLCREAIGKVPCGELLMAGSKTSRPRHHRTKNVKQLPMVAFLP